ncbi:MAG TPA: GAF domain-containing protein, partial [Ktedonobacteraceae bacterium]|nr:GAF domain-containing protein [Ktedonobacteraceae bacterium]
MQSSVRDYWSVWKQFVLHGAMQGDVLPPAVLQSWRRCAAAGLDAYSTRATYDAPELSLLSASSPSTLLALVRPAIEDLYQFVEGSECVVVFANTDARIIDLVGDSTTQEHLGHLGVSVGATWHEERQGSNALALALRESFPIQLDGAMHYRAALHHIYTSAAPVHDLMGQTVGVIGVIGPHEHCHPHTLGMITAAAQAISNQLQMQVWLSNANDLLSELRTILQSLPEGILLLRRDGMISQMNTPAGTMLGLMPAKVTGRRIHDILPLPTALAQAFTT